VSSGAGVSPADLAAMRRALELAQRAAQLGEVPVGAVVYETASGRTVGEGYNRRHLDKDPTAHAELLAIRQAAFTLGDWRLSGCTLAVTLEPCPMCAGLIVNARLGRLLYGAADPKAGAVETLYRLTEDPRLNHRVTPIGGVLAEQASELLTSFFKGLRSAATRQDPSHPQPFDEDDA
jgi:tRNA(adenine34) deaminase